MGTILVGYDTETAAVGEALCLFTESPHFPLYELALDPETCREALELLTEVHADVGVPATLFVCGRTLLHALEPVRAAKASGLFDVQQHTFSHVPFKDIVYSPGPGLVGTIKASPPEALLEELAVTSRLIARPRRRRRRRRADAVRLPPRPARPARPARDRPRDRAPLRHLMGPQRGERQSDSVGAAVRLRRRRATPTSSSCRSSSGSTSSGSTSTATTPGRRCSRR